jgi:CRP-like cAMP-binding protein
MLFVQALYRRSPSRAQCCSGVASHGVRVAASHATTPPTARARPPELAFCNTDPLERHVGRTLWQAEPRPDAHGERNRLLAALPAEEYQWLESKLERVHLESKRVLAWPMEPIRHVYFLRDGVVAFLVPMQNGMAVEGATVGNEGIVGVEVFLSDGSSGAEIVQVIPGEAVRIRAHTFREALTRSTVLRSLLNEYTQTLMNQLARTSGCNRVHPVQQRCARWLLMSSDRVGRDTFPITHDVLAILLGVRRASITQAAGRLQEAGLIAYRRGQMTICDREGLEQEACEDYRLCRERYDRSFVRRVP